MVLPSSEENSFLEAMLDKPDDQLLRLVFADWLEERGDPRGELLRLTDTLTQTVDIPNRPALELRLQTLLKEDVQPIGPFWTNSLGMRFAWIPAGTFLMGSPLKEEKRQNNETQHKVTLTKGFYMGVHLVTQEQWQTVMGNNPSYFKGEKNLPVEQVSWEDCQQFVNKLREQEKPYRLPTEAEWEYACRAGTTTPYHFGETEWEYDCRAKTTTPYHFGDTISTEQANCYAPSEYGEKTTSVGGFPANAWGLHDMHGDLWQWCQDLYGDYPANDVVDPQGPDVGGARVVRGGSWTFLNGLCRAAGRYGVTPKVRNDNRGFRVCFRLD